MKINANFAVLALLSGTPIASAKKKPGHKKPPKDSNKAKTYIVTFNNKKGDPSVQCADIAKEFEGSTIGHIYDKVLNGCSITIPSIQSDFGVATASHLSTISAISGFEEDQEVYASEKLFDKDLSNEGMVTTSSVFLGGLIVLISVLCL